jgi:hypothetical protein
MLNLSLLKDYIINYWTLFVNDCPTLKKPVLSLPKEGRKGDFNHPFFPKSGVRQREGRSPSPMNTLSKQRHQGLNNTRFGEGRVR